MSLPPPLEARRGITLDVSVAIRKAARQSLPEHLGQISAIPSLASLTGTVEKLAKTSSATPTTNTLDCLLIRTAHTGTTYTRYLPRDSMLLLATARHGCDRIGHDIGTWGPTFMAPLFMFHRVVLSRKAVGSLQGSEHLSFDQAEGRSEHRQPEIEVEELELEKVHE